MAKIADGAYHQFLYQMGYTPHGKIIVAVGTGAGSSNPCCSNYPNLGVSPCVKSIGGPPPPSYTISGGESCGLGFICNTCKLGQCPDGQTCNCNSQAIDQHYTYYNCKNDALNKATNNIQICDNQSPTPCIKPSSLPSFPSSFSNCTPSPSTWCDCNNFMAGAKSHLFDEEVTLDS